MLRREPRRAVPLGVTFRGENRPDHPRNVTLSVKVTVSSEDLTGSYLA